MKKILVILLTGSLLFANSAFAGRFGGARNSGMQRSVAPSSNNSNHYQGAPQANNGFGNTAQQQQTRTGMRPGTAAMLGAAAAGAAGGYMLGKNSNTPNASGVVSTEAKSSIPWGTIIILIAILILGLIFFRKKTNPGLSGNPMNNYTSHSSSNFNLPNINRINNKVQQSGQKVMRSALTPPISEQLDKMPDGIETIYFLRQVKGMFLHIQSMNNAENLNEIQKYMTPQLFTEVKNDIANNTVIADFTNLDCQLISSEAIEAKAGDDGQAIEAQLIASVKFSGNVSENPEAESTPFSEIWNFVKSANTNNKWVAAGIQQEAPKK